MSYRQDGGAAPPATVKPLSGRRLSNIEQYKQRAAQKRQERIQGGGLAKQSLSNHSVLQRNGGPRSTLQPLPPSNYSNPLSQANQNRGRTHTKPASRDLTAQHGGNKTTSTTTTVAPPAERRPPHQPQGLARRTAGGGAPAAQSSPVRHFAPPEDSSRAREAGRDLGSAPAPLENAMSAVNLFQDGRGRGSFKSDTEQQLQAQGIKPVYEPQAHRERSEQQRGSSSNASVVPDLSDKRLFLMQPGPRSGHVQCTIKREKGNFGMYPKYVLRLDGPEGEFLLSARKRKKSKSSNYLISLDKDDLARQSRNYFGKLRSNFIGTEFVIFDKGSKPHEKGAKGIQPNVRSELGGVLYQHNILGTRGPRKMTVVIPSLDSRSKRKSFVSDQKGESIMDLFKQTNGDTDDMIVYQNKSPAWNEQLGAFCLNFNGRVTEASVKNFQLVETDESDDVVCQFGKISDNEFTMDYKYPMSALQAFAVCLTSFDGKLACE